MSSWEALGRECDAWQASDRAVELWWRDDDAVADSDALRRLLARLTVPVALAACMKAKHGPTRLVARRPP